MLQNKTIRVPRPARLSSCLEPAATAWLWRGLGLAWPWWVAGGASSQGVVEGMVLGEAAREHRGHRLLGGERAWEGQAPGQAGTFWRGQLGPGKGPRAGHKGGPT